MKVCEQNERQTHRPRRMRAEKIGTLRAKLIVNRVARPTDRARTTTLRTSSSCRSAYTHSAPSTSACVDFSALHSRATLVLHARNQPRHSCVSRRARLSPEFDACAKHEFTHCPSNRTYSSSRLGSSAATCHRATTPVSRSPECCAQSFVRRRGEALVTHRARRSKTTSPRGEVPTWGTMQCDTRVCTKRIPN